MFSFSLISFLTFQVPKFHLSVASLPYRKSLESEVIIDVPSKAEKRDTVLQDSEVTNIYQFSGKYCVSDSSEDDEQSSSKTLIGQSLKTCDAASLGVSSRSSMMLVDNRCETLSCSLIECSIGNRLFRLSANNEMTIKNEFQEILQDGALSREKRSRVI